jgi:hypothetical protein
MLNSSSVPEPSRCRPKLKWWRDRMPVAKLLEWMGLNAGVQETAKNQSINHGLLLERRMRALDLDPYELRHTEPALFNHLQQCCRSCTSCVRCRNDLAREAVGRIGRDRHNWLQYCPNGQPLEMLSAVQGRAKQLPKSLFPLFPYLG